MKKVTSIIVGLSMILIFSPFFVSAQTMEETLQAQIASLIQQINSLKAQLSQLQGKSESTAFCHNFNTNFGIGVQSEDASSLHTILVKEGVAYERSSNFSASYDEVLASSVSSFQEKYKSEILTPAGLRSGTGYVGANTRAKLNKLYGCSISSSSVVISGISGPQSLNINEQGTWAVTASGSNGGNLSYSVVWGDESSAGLSSTDSTFRAPQQSATFTHSYSQSKIYTPIFIVMDSSGQKAQTSLNVYVGNTPVLTSFVTVLSPNSGEVWTKGTTQTIKWVDKTPFPTCPPGFGCVQVMPSSNYDIKLVSYYPPCTGNVCPAYAYRMPYTIAKNIHDSFYNWSVGKVLDFDSIAPDGSYTIQVCQSGTDVCDSSDNYFKIVSNTASLSITTTSLPNGLVADKYEASILATGGTGSYDWSLSKSSVAISGSLPPGLSLVPAVCFSAPCQGPVTIVGTPTTAGVYTFTIQVSSSPLVGDGPTLMATKQFTITVYKLTL